MVCCVAACFQELLSEVFDTELGAEAMPTLRTSITDFCMLSAGRLSAQNAVNGEYSGRREPVTKRGCEYLDSLVVVMTPVFYLHGGGVRRAFLPHMSRVAILNFCVKHKS